MNTKKMVLLSIFISQALILHFIERMIPVNFAMPGAKLGLANIISVAILYLWGSREAFAVLIIRCVMGSLMFGGGVMSFMYSISGGIFSLISMIALKIVFEEYLSEIGISVSGALFHNIGQILMAVFLIGDIRISLYLPALLTASLGTGIFVGICSRVIIKQAKRLGFQRSFI